MRFFVPFLLVFWWMNLGLGMITFRGSPVEGVNHPDLGYGMMWAFGLVLTCSGLFFSLWLQAIMSEAMYKLYTYEPKYPTTVFSLLVGLSGAAFIVGVLLYWPVVELESVWSSHIGFLLMVNGVLGLIQMYLWRGLESHWDEEILKELAKSPNC